MTRRRTISYGSHASQYGVLTTPSVAGPQLPTVVLVHGGFWRSAYDLHLMDPLADDLARRGHAVWNIEYRRVGEEGGGWPGTFLDVAAAVDHLVELAIDEPLELDRLAAVGHSAGGHLALWLAGRGALPPGAPGAAPLVTPRLVVGQGPVADLLAVERDGLSRGAVVELLGTSAEHPDRYSLATPRIPATISALVVRGTVDVDVPPRYSLLHEAAGVDVVDVDGDDHFDLIDPASASWAAVVDHLARV